MKNASFASKSRFVAALLAFICIGGLFAVTLFAPHSSLLDLRFNPFALLSATTLCIDLGLLVFFLTRPARTEERVWLTVFLGALITYAIGELFERLSATPGTAAFWVNVSDVGSLAPVALYLFSLAYTNHTDRRFPGTVAVLLVGSLLLVFFYAFTNSIWSNDPSKFVLQPWGYDFADVKSAGSGLYFSFLWYDGLSILALARFISFRRHTRNATLRTQSLIFVWATIIPLVLGTFTDGILPAVGVNIPSLVITLYTPAGFLIVFGIIRYQLLTISPTLFSNTILAIMQEAVVVTDKLFNVLYMNERGAALLGVSSDAASKLSLASVIAPDSLSKFKLAFQNNGGKTIDVDHVDIVAKHDTTVPVRLISSPFKVGKDETWITVLTDITKELQTRHVIEQEVQIRTRELHEARAYLVSSINSLEQGFVLVNAKGSIELMNNVAAALFGQTTDTVAGTTMAEALHTKGWNVNLMSTVDHTLETRRARSLMVTSADGSFYQIYVTPVLTGEHILGVTVVIQDITEQKILDRSKDEFFSIASHELRTPLTAIRGNMSMVKDYFPEALKDENFATMINDTHAASIRLIEIVNDFLDSSRLEQGKMVFDLQQVAVEPAVKDVIKDLEPILKTHNNTIKLEGFDKLPTISVDEARYRQIVYNLLSNATKYSQDGAITVLADHDDKHVVLHITDTGKGISPENQKLLFHKFQQASDPLTRDDTKGTGLGLYIAKLLATSMHGDVELERTEVGKGSTFKLVLSRAKS